MGKRGKKGKEVKGTKGEKGEREKGKKRSEEKRQEATEIDRALVIEAVVVRTEDTGDVFDSPIISEALVVPPEPAEKAAKTEFKDAEKTENPEKLFGMKIV